VKKLVQRAEDTTRKRGLIWHTQGSGKTYTMIAAARLILQNPAFSNPTVIMLVDRNELEAQLFGNLKSVGFEIDEDRIAQSKKHLKELLQKDARGLIVSTIQKFEGMPANINTRDNIFVLVDEAHRTTTGDLGNYLMSALPNATYFGFTGKAELLYTLFFYSLFSAPFFNGGNSIFQLAAKGNIIPLKSLLETCHM